MFPKEIFEKNVFERNIWNNQKCFLYSHQSVTFLKNWHKRISEYICIKNITRTNVRIYLYQTKLTQTNVRIYWYKPMSEWIFVTNIFDYSNIPIYSSHSGSHFNNEFIDNDDDDDDRSD